MIALFPFDVYHKISNLFISRKSQFVSIHHRHKIHFIEMTFEGKSHYLCIENFSKNVYLQGARKISKFSQTESLMLFSVLVMLKMSIFAKVITLVLTCLGGANFK